jgi:signal transduction histidine kinase
MANAKNFTETNLAKQIDLLELLFERMPMGIAILDREFNVQRYNLTWVDFSKRYAPADSEPLSPGVNYFKHLPGTEASILPLYERVLEGEIIHQNNVQLIAGEITTYWDIVLAPIEANHTVQGILSIAVDATERVELQQNLEKRVTQRTNELNRRRQIAESLRGIIKVINSSLSLPDTLAYIVEEACQVLQSEACLIHRIQEADNFVAIEASYGLPEVLQDIPGFPLGSSEKSDSKILNKEPVWVNDFSKRMPLSEEATQNSPPEVIKWRRLTDQYYRAWLAVPLVVQGKVYGSMAFYYAAPQKFDEEMTNLSQSFADQAALAIENASLHNLEMERLEESERRRKVAEAFGKVLAILNSDRPLNETLTYVSSQAHQLTKADASVIYMLDLDQKTIELVAGCQLPDEFTALGELAFSDSSAYESIVKGEPYVVEDVQNLFNSFSAGNVPLLTSLVLDYYRAALLVPIIISEVTYGAIALFYANPVKFEEEDISLAVSFADQAALALENANLRLHAEKTAIAAERNRLARDLHDAVTQTLFSSSMIADVLPKIWARNPEEGQRRLEELRQLTRGALSEMRTLLVELRPAALEDTNLEDLIQHQINAFISRTGLKVEFEEECDFNPAPAIKEMFYRIVQEALNNISKHAGASSVQIQLKCQPEGTEIVIRDDGIGFDTQKAENEGLGLNIMQERASVADGRLTIQSQIGSGTELRVVWPDKKITEEINE